MSHKQFPYLVHGSFPTEPVPQTFFWSECDGPIQPDIPGELQNRMAHRRWPEVKLIDWLMVGVAPCVARTYLEPSTFLYYLPSLLVGVFNDLGYMDFAIEGILPFNKTHQPRGKWWSTFSACVSENKRVTLQSFLTVIRSSEADGLTHSGAAR